MHYQITTLASAWTVVRYPPPYCLAGPDIRGCRALGVKLVLYCAQRRRGRGMGPTVDALEKARSQQVIDASGVKTQGDDLATTGGLSPSTPQCRIFQHPSRVVVLPVVRSTTAAYCDSGRDNVKVPRSTKRAKISSERQARMSPIVSAVATVIKRSCLMRGQQRCCDVSGRRCPKSTTRCPPSAGTRYTPNIQITGRPREVGREATIAGNIVCTMNAKGKVTYARSAASVEDDRCEA